MYKLLCGYIFFSQIGTYKWNCLATLFNFLRNYQTVFQSCCTILHPYQRYTRVLTSPYP